MPLQEIYPTHIVAVSALVTDGRGRILLMRHPRRGWEFPGGQVENGEDLIAALQREVKEETGISIRVGRLVCVNSNVKREGEIPTKVMFDFLATAASGKLRVSDESPEVGWFSRVDASRMVTHPAIRSRLRIMLADKARLVYRAYSKNPYRVHSRLVVH
jgi:8-oxo-dGTP diphosphatase